MGVQLLIAVLLVLDVASASHLRNIQTLENDGIQCNKLGDTTATWAPKAKCQRCAWKCNNKGQNCKALRRFCQHFKDKSWFSDVAKCKPGQYFDWKSRDGRGKLVRYCAPCPANGATCDSVTDSDGCTASCVSSATKLEKPEVKTGGEHNHPATESRPGRACDDWVKLKASQISCEECDDHSCTKGTCANGYFWHSSRRCGSCAVWVQKNCAECSSDGTTMICDACDSGFVLDPSGQCFSVDSHISKPEPEKPKPEPISCADYEQKGKCPSGSKAAKKGKGGKPPCKWIKETRTCAENK